MKRFYRIFSNEKVSTAWTQLTYSHLRLLFNIKFNCYVVVELKVTEFKSEYISQVQKFCSDERIAVRKYELV